jgi:hypothetical protein
MGGIREESKAIGQNTSQQLHQEDSSSKAYCKAEFLT